MTTSPPTTEPTVPAAPVLAAVFIAHPPAEAWANELRVVHVFDFYPKETP